MPPCRFLRLILTPGCATIGDVNDVLPTLIAVGGWLGAAELLLAYALVSRRRIAGDSLRYQALNITGSVLLMVNCAYTGAWPSALANVFYLAVGLWMLATVKRTYLTQLAWHHRARVRTRLRPRRRGALAS